MDLKTGFRASAAKRMYGDVFHVSEHLHACGRVLHGEHTPQAREWVDQRLATLLSSGPMSLLRDLEQTLQRSPISTTQEALKSLIDYLKPNIDGMWYRDRLKRGLPIGSGMVEGACKTVVGRRLKGNGARWTVPLFCPTGTSRSLLRATLIGSKRPMGWCGKPTRRNTGPATGLGTHQEFAIKYDGVNLAILARIFRAADAAEITAYVMSKPTGKYARRIWYLYEWITGKRLPLDDLKQGNYVDLLEPNVYVTSLPIKQVRQRINNNLLGNDRFCPTIRRTETIQRFMNAGLRERCQQVVAKYPPE